MSTEAQQMARPADPQRRARTLAAAADYVLEHGLAGLSLRPLASALGTSTRMLLYDFSSKEELIIAVLAEIRHREAAMLAAHTDAPGASGPELIRAVWDWAGSAERTSFMRLFFEVYIEAIADPGTYSQQGRAMVTEWLDQFGAALAGTPADAAGTASATLVIAVLRGLLLDRLSTGDQERTDRALDLFTQLIATQEQRPGPTGHATRARHPPDPGQARTHQER
jgi:AcrR family transcriptional regulator